MGESQFYTKHCVPGIWNNTKIDYNLARTSHRVAKPGREAIFSREFVTINVLLKIGWESNTHGYVDEHDVVGRPQYIRVLKDREDDQ